jgi:hypothetical protein
MGACTVTAADMVFIRFADVRLANIQRQGLAYAIGASASDFTPPLIAGPSNHVPGNSQSTGVSTPIIITSFAGNPDCPMRDEGENTNSAHSVMRFRNSPGSSAGDLLVRFRWMIHFFHEAEG